MATHDFDIGKLIAESSRCPRAVADHIAQNSQVVSHIINTYLKDQVGEDVSPELVFRKYEDDKEFRSMVNNIVLTTASDIPAIRERAAVIAEARAIISESTRDADISDITEEGIGRFHHVMRSAQNLLIDCNNRVCTGQLDQQGSCLIRTEMCHEVGSEEYNEAMRDMIRYRLEESPDNPSDCSIDGIARRALHSAMSDAVALLMKCNTTAYNILGLGTPKYDSVRAVILPPRNMTSEQHDSHFDAGGYTMFRLMVNVTADVGGSANRLTTITNALCSINLKLLDVMPDLAAGDIKREDITAISKLTSDFMNMATGLAEALDRNRSCGGDSRKDTSGMTVACALSAIGALQSNSIDVLLPKLGGLEHLADAFLELTGEHHGVAINFHTGLSTVKTLDVTATTSIDPVGAVGIQISPSLISMMPDTSLRDSISDIVPYMASTVNQLLDGFTSLLVACHHVYRIPSLLKFKTPDVAQLAELLLCDNVNIASFTIDVLRLRYCTLEELSRLFKVAGDIGIAWPSANGTAASFRSLYHDIEVLRARCKALLFPDDDFIRRLALVSEDAISTRIICISKELTQSILMMRQAECSTATPESRAALADRINDLRVKATEDVNMMQGLVVRNADLNFPPCKDPDGGDTSDADRVYTLLTTDLNNAMSAANQASGFESTLNNILPEQYQYKTGISRLAINEPLHEDGEYLTAAGKNLDGYRKFTQEAMTHRANLSAYTAQDTSFNITNSAISQVVNTLKTPIATSAALIDTRTAHFSEQLSLLSPVPRVAAISNDLRKNSVSFVVAQLHLFGDIVEKANPKTESSWEALRSVLHNSDAYGFTTEFVNIQIDSAMRECHSGGQNLGAEYSDVNSKMSDPMIVKTAILEQLEEMPSVRSRQLTKLRVDQVFLMLDSIRSAAELITAEGSFIANLFEKILACDPTLVHSVMSYITTRKFNSLGVFGTESSIPDTPVMQLRLGIIDSTMRLAPVAEMMNVLDEASVAEASRLTAAEKVTSKRVYDSQKIEDQTEAIDTGLPPGPTRPGAEAQSRSCRRRAKTKSNKAKTGKKSTKAGKKSPLGVNIPLSFRKVLYQATRSAHARMIRDSVKCMTSDIVQVIDVLMGPTLDVDAFSTVILDLLTGDKAMVLSIVNIIMTVSIPSHCQEEMRRRVTHLVTMTERRLIDLTNIALHNITPGGTSIFDNAGFLTKEIADYTRQPILAVDYSEFISELSRTIGTSVLSESMTAAGVNIAALLANCGSAERDFGPQIQHHLSRMVLAQIDTTATLGVVVKELLECDVRNNLVSRSCGITRVFLGREDGFNSHLGFHIGKIMKEDSLNVIFPSLGIITAMLDVIHQVHSLMYKDAIPSAAIGSTIAAVSASSSVRNDHVRCRAALQSLFFKVDSAVEPENDKDAKIKYNLIFQNLFGQLIYTNFENEVPGAGGQTGLQLLVNLNKALAAAYVSKHVYDVSTSPRYGEIMMSQAIYVINQYSKALNNNKDALRIYLKQSVTRRLADCLSAIGTIDLGHTRPLIECASPTHMRPNAEYVWKSTSDIPELLTIIRGIFPLIADNKLESPSDLESAMAMYTTTGIMNNSNIKGHRLSGDMLKTCVTVVQSVLMGHIPKRYTEHPQTSDSVEVPGQVETVEVPGQADSASTTGTTMSGEIGTDEMLQVEVAKTQGSIDSSGGEPATLISSINAGSPAPRLATTAPQAAMTFGPETPLVTNPPSRSKRLNRHIRPRSVVSNTPPSPELPK